MAANSGLNLGPGFGGWGTQQRPDELLHRELAVPERGTVRRPVLPDPDSVCQGAPVNQREFSLANQPSVRMEGHSRRELQL